MSGGLELLRMVEEAQRASEFVTAVMHLLRHGALSREQAEELLRNLGFSDVQIKLVTSVARGD